MKHFCSSIIFLLFSFFAYSQQNFIVAKQLELRGEVYISLDAKNVYKNMSSLAYLSFDKIEDGRCFFYANAKGIQALNYENLYYKVEPIPSMITNVNMASSLADFTTNWDAYPTYQQYDSLMLQFAANYPNICKLHILGTLNSGREIIALQLGDSVNINTNKPQFLYTSSMHGDELTGYIMMLRLIDYLLSNYGNNSEVDFLMNNIDIWINPLANPDGAYYSGNSTVFGATRYNANSVDINRNFPDPEDGLHPDGNVYQSETQIFMNLADSLHFTMAANFHGGSEVVNYPWDTWSRLPADNNWWIHESKRFADSAQFYSPNTNYMTKFGTGYTNGYQWYSISGGRQDYMNYYKHCREVTIELSNAKTVAENLLPNYWNYLKSSLLNYLHDVTFGFHGQTTDSLTHFAVKTQISILNYDKDSSQIYSNDSGYYFRPIAQGNYDLKFSAPGYYSKIIYNKYIAWDSTSLLNVMLVPKPDIINNTLVNNQIRIFPNPTKSVVNIKSDLNIESVFLISPLGNVLEEWNNFNRKQIKIDLSMYNVGVYFIKINNKYASQIKKIIIE